MHEFEMELNVNPVEYIKIIKSSIPNYCDIDKKFMPYKYSYKIKNGKISIIGRQMGLPDTIFNIQLITNNETGTKLRGKFDENILSRFFIWVCTSFLFIGSISLMREIIVKGSPIITCWLPLLIITASISYFVYTEKGIKNQQTRIISLVKNTFALKQ